MSQPSNSKGKDISGKKYASLNVNQTYKGTKVENRSAAGQTRHGMQSLGKIAQNRRLPPPANLPSLKKENLGNDPTVNLVPTGSSGWGKKEKTAAKTEEQAQASQQKPQKVEQAPEISLRPNAGAAPKNQSDQGKGWSNLQTTTGSAPQPPANSFQREFPRLGGDAGGQSTQESAREQDLDERGIASDTSMPQRPSEQKWMGGQGPGQMPLGAPGVRPTGPRMDFNFPRDQQRPIFNGAHMQPPAGSQFYPPFGPGMVPPYMHMMPYPYPYPNRMPPPGSMGQPTRPTTTKTDASERPATVKQEDIQKMDDEPDDGGWAGEQEEVDYTAKLNFDESDEEPEVAKKSSDSKTKSSDGSTAGDKDQSKRETTESRNTEGRPEAWEEQPPGFQGQMQYRHPQWIRGPFPQHFDPNRGPPGQGYPYPPPWMYPMPNAYRMPGMPPQRNPENGQPVSHQPVHSPVPGSVDRPDSRDSEKPGSQSMERRKKDDDMERPDEERRAKAAAKLQVLEAKIKKREEMEKRRDSESSSKSGRRERLDSDNSDSSRGGAQRQYPDKFTKTARETPPRFKKQNSLAKTGKGTKADATTPSSGDAADSGPVTRIMKRRDSLKSDDASSVHSQDSWVNIPTSDQAEQKYDSVEQSLPVQRSEESEYMKKVSENSGIVDLPSSKSYERERQGVKADSTKDEDVKKSKSSDKRVALKADQRSELKKDSGEAKSQKEITREDNKTEAKKDSKKYDYRQEKVKLKETRVDGRQGRKEQDFESSSRPPRDDKRYRGKEQSSRWKERDDYKSEGLKDSKQDEMAARRVSSEEIAAERKLEHGQPGDKEKTKDRNQEGRSKDGSNAYKYGEFPSKSRPDNFKRLEKSKPRNMSVKLSQSKEDSRDKSADKAQQGKDSDSKRPSAWAQVVSGETNDGSTDSSATKGAAQPKKTLPEIQAEEEIKEIEKNKSFEKEQEKLKREEKEKEKRTYDPDKRTYDSDKRTYDPDTRRQPKMVRDRKPEDRPARRGFHDDSYYDRKENYGRRRPDYTRDKKDYGDYRTKDRYDQGSRDEKSADKYEKERDYRGSGYDERRRVNNEFRKRKHEDTERAEDTRGKHDQEYSDDDVNEGKSSAAADGKGFGQESSDRQFERRKYSDRGRGARGGRGSSSSRGRGRGSFSGRATSNRDGSYGSKPVQRVSVESLSDKSQGSHASDTIDAVAADSVGRSQPKEDETRTEKRDSRKGKENKEPERKETGQPYRRSDERRRGSARSREDQSYVEHFDSRSRYEKKDAVRGRGRGRGYNSTAFNSAKRDSTHERSQAAESTKAERNVAADTKEAERYDDEKKSLKKANAKQDDGSDYEDDDYYTDEESDSADKEGNNYIKQPKEGHTPEMSREDKKDWSARSQSRGRGRGQTASRGYGDKPSNDDRRYDGSYKSGRVPPRFQKQIDSHSDLRRGRGFRVRGSRSRGRSSYPAYGTRGQGFGKPPSSREVKPSSSQTDEGKDNYVSGESDDDTFHSADGSINSADEEAPTKDYKQHKEHDSSKRYSSRGRYTSSRSGRGRGARGSRGGNSNHFLADRQQERVGHIDTSEWAVTLPAAGKISFPGSKTAEDKSGARVEGKRIGTAKRQTDGHSLGHSIGTNEALSEVLEPPKKIAKSKLNEKVDLLRQFDVNNIASVVCIDDMPQNSENADNLSQAENDGFVQVTSRKAQKFLRERQKEEEKRKMQEELSTKSVKKTSADTKDSTYKPGKPTKFTDHQSQRVTHSYPQSSGQVAVADVTQSQASNAAMAAVGGWEPAQALLRGVQTVTPTDNLESSKSVAIPAPPPAMNAWKRPLSFASSLASTTTTMSHAAPHSVPDPKAVGTGKPNSSPAKQLPGIPAGQTSDVIHTGAHGYNDSSISDDAKLQASASENAELVSANDSRQLSQKQTLARKAEQRKVNKGTKRETAPRFQNMAKSKSLLNTRLVNGDVSRPKKKLSATAEDVTALGVSTLHGDDRAPGKRPDGSKLRRCNSESGKEEPVTGLPALNYGEQPAISFIQDDSQSNTKMIKPDIKDQLHKDAMMNERLGKVEIQSHTQEEDNVKGTARTVIKSLGDDDEKNLETRSLPSSTPPLVVDIHAPRSNGPSSDPGKGGPAIPVSNSLTQEVNEMSMKVLSAKKIWDNMPSQVSEALSVVTSSKSRTAWSEEDGPGNTSVTAPSIATSSADSGNQEGPQIKEHVVTQTPVAIVAAQVLDSTDNDNSSEGTSSGGFIAKKTIIESQNNVCKVKPQQKQSQQSAVEDKQHLITSFSNGQLFPSQFPFQQSYALPVQASTSHSKLQQQPYVLSDSTTSAALFPQRETAHRELPSQHSQPQIPVNLQQINQVRPSSPLSRQHQDILQPSVMLSNIYGTTAIQGTQQSPVLWPVISRHAMPSSSSYLSQQQSHERHSDILNSSPSFPSTPVYMTFDQGNSSILSAQRLNSQIQQTPALGLVLPQQSLRSGSMLNVMRTNQASKESPLYSMSLSPSPFHQNTELQLAGPTHSDMTKHVNAKPFQPSSRTPPSAQSSQMMRNQSHLIGQFNKLIGPSVNLQQQQPSHQQLAEHHLSSISHSEKQHSIQQHTLQSHSVQQQSHVLAVQPHGSMQHSNQPAQHQVQPVTLQQHATQQQAHGQQHFMQHHSFQSPHVAAVGPRPMQNRAASSASPTLQSQNRIGTLSPVDPSLQFVHGASSSMKGISQTHQHGHLVQPGSHSGNLVQVLPQGQSLSSHAPQTRPFIVRPSQTFPSFQQAVPGPIKRPQKQPAVNPALPVNRPKQPVVPIVNNSDVSPTLPSASHAPASSFRSEEHQKMIEETRKYFASQSKADPTPKVATVPASSSSLPTAPAQLILARPVEKRVTEEPQPTIVKEEAVDIPAAAMLNDPTDIDSIIKSRPSLAKALKSAPGSKQEKVSRQSGKKSFPKKSQDKEEKPKRAEIAPSSKAKIDQKTGVATPIAQRSDRSKPAQKGRTDGNNRKH